MFVKMFINTYFYNGLGNTKPISLNSLTFYTFNMVVQQMFKYRIYPSGKQKIKIVNNFKVCKSAYNNLLAISIDAYKFGKVSLTKFDYDAINKGYAIDSTLESRKSFFLTRLIL